MTSIPSCSARPDGQCQPLRRAGCAAWPPEAAQPPGLGTFQGYAVYGEYLYLLDGEAYSSSNPPPGTPT
jgi:hypothetical protein